MTDEPAALTWWQSLTAEQRRHWQRQAGSLRPSDAWHCYVDRVYARRRADDGGEYRLSPDPEASATAGPPPLPRPQRVILAPFERPRPKLVPDPKVQAAVDAFWRSLAADGED